MKKFGLSLIAFLMLTGCGNTGGIGDGSSQSANASEAYGEQTVLTIPERDKIETNQGQTMANILKKYRGTRIDENDIDISSRQILGDNLLYGDTNYWITIEDMPDSKNQSIFVLNEIQGDDDEAIRELLSKNIKLTENTLQKLTTLDISDFTEKVSETFEELPEGDEIKEYLYTLDEWNKVGLSLQNTTSQSDNSEESYSFDVIFNAKGDKMDKVTQFVNIYDSLIDDYQELFPQDSFRYVTLNDSRFHVEGDPNSPTESAILSPMSSSQHSVYGLEEAYQLNLYFSQKVEAQIDLPVFLDLLEENLDTLPDDISVDKAKIIDEMTSAYDEVSSTGQITRRDIQGEGYIFFVSSGLSGDALEGLLYVFLDKDGNVITDNEVLEDVIKSKSLFS